MKRKIVIISLILILISLIGYLVVYLIKDKQSKQQDIAKEILYSNYTDFVPAQSEEIVDTLGAKELSNPTLLYNGFTYVIPLPKSLDEVEINYMNNIYAKDGSFFIYLREGEQKNDLEDYKINNPLCNIISFYDKSNKVLLQIQCTSSIITHLRPVELRLVLFKSSTSSSYRSPTLDILYILIQSIEEFPSKIAALCLSVLPLIYKDRSLAIEVLPIPALPLKRITGGTAFLSSLLIKNALTLLCPIISSKLCNIFIPFYKLPKELYHIL